MFGGRAEADEPVAESVSLRPEAGETPLQLFEFERASAYFVTGGLVAVHSAGRDQARDLGCPEAQGGLRHRAGDRTLLWFDLVDTRNGRALAHG